MGLGMVTIRDVAKEAGVSAATVSRVINNTSNVDLRKKEKVMQAIKKLGYKPNEVARSLSNKKSNNIGLLLPNITNPFFNQITEAVENTANECGYKIILCNTHDDPLREREYIDSLIFSQCDGFIVISDSAVLDEFTLKYDIPAVALDRYVSHDQRRSLKYPIVTTDNYAGGRLAASHLLECGCARMAHIGRPEGSKLAELRARGFGDVLKENGMDFFNVTCPFSYYEGLIAAERLFESYPNVDGIFAGNDMIAFAVITVAFNKGIRIPEQVQLIGFDDVLFSRLVTPALTTITQSIGLLGRNAAELLIKKINRENVANEVIVFPCQLVERNTTRNPQKNV